MTGIIMEFDLPLVSRVVNEKTEKSREETGKIWAGGGGGVIAHAQWRVLLILVSL